jgi:hypothetical protein
MKNSDFCTQNICQFKKKPKKPTSRCFFLGFFSWVFLGFIGRVFLGGFFIANPAICWILMSIITNALNIKFKPKILLKIGTN